jgi:hypothetical protein
LISSPYDKAPSSGVDIKFSQTPGPSPQAKFNHKGQFKSLRIPPKGTPKKAKKYKKIFKTRKQNSKKTLNHKGLFKHFEILKIPLRELRSKHLACPPISSLFLNWT